MKGKQAAAAARRRAEDASVRIAELEKRLADERAAHANTRIEAEQEVRALQSRILNARKDGAIAARLKAEADIVGAHREREDAVRLAAAERKGMMEVVDFLFEHFTTVHQMNPDDVAQMHVFETDSTPNTSERGMSKLSEETRKRLRRVKADQAWGNHLVSQSVPKPKS